MKYEASIMSTDYFEVKKKYTPIVGFLAPD